MAELEIKQSFGREDYLLLARLAQQTERYHEMIEFINEFVHLDGELA